MIARMTRSIGRAGLGLALAGMLAGCAASDRGSDPQGRFIAGLAKLCGKAFAGRVVSTDAADREMAAKPLVIHVARCEPGAIRIPFHVGEDRSRTWVITRTATGLRLKHDHRHADGSPDALTMYGGDTATPGTAERQAFPVDAESIAMFRANGLPRSVTNVWAVELRPGLFAYELRRPEGPDKRFFRVEFDLTKAVAPPPPAWGD
jgi:hypothetical protein